MPKNSPRAKKVIIDTSSLISLVHGELLESVLSGFEVVVTKTVLSELEETAQFEDEGGEAAATVLKHQDELKISKAPREGVREVLTGSLDIGEATCIVLAKARGEGIDALISDDFKAMAHLEYYSNKEEFDLGPCAVLIRALQLRGDLSKKKAGEAFERIAEKRDWMGRPIYEYGKKFL